MRAQFKFSILSALVLLIFSLSLSSLIYSTPDENYQHYSPSSKLSPIGSKSNERLSDTTSTRIIIYIISFVLLGAGGIFIASGKILKPVSSLTQLRHSLESALTKQKHITAGIAHELRNPLTSIKTEIQLLKSNDHADLNTYKEQINQTEIAVERMMRLIDEMLFLSNSSENTALELEAISLDFMFFQLFEDLSAFYGDKFITHQISCSNICYYANFTLIYQAFYNLVDNAYKYTPANGVITLLVTDTETSIFVNVQDTGIGISKENLSFIFDPFFRVKSIHQKNTRGSGLGLSIVKTILELHNGSISVSSNLGIGSCFTVELPK